jgi:hypothetical protein
MRAFSIFAVCVAVTLAGSASAQDVDWKKVDESLGTDTGSRALICRSRLTASHSGPRWHSADGWLSSLRMGAP